MSESAGLIAFRLATEISPIILTGGIAPLGVLPIVALTEGLNAVDQLLSSGSLSLDDFFAHYQVVPGGNLINYDAAETPWANQAIAADAIIQRPLSISLQMICPARGNFGAAVKLATMIAVKKMLDQHNLAGGLYSVITPAYIYSGCILRSMRDVSGGETQQSQVRWQLDFYQPQTSQQGLQSVLNSAMQKINAQVDPSLSAGDASGILGVGNQLGAAGGASSP